MKTTTIPAVVYTVGVGFTAKPGDEIVVAGGVCMGIYTGNGNEPAMWSAAVPIDTTINAAPAKPKRVDQSSVLTPVVFSVMNQCLVLLDTHGPMNNPEMERLLTKQQWAVRHATTYAKRRGYVVTKGNKRAIKYALTLAGKDYLATLARQDAA